MFKVVNFSKLDNISTNVKIKIGKKSLGEVLYGKC